MIGFSGLYCDRARLWASLAADGEASASELASLRAHIGVCPECEAWAAGLTVLVDGLRSAAPVEPERTLFLAPARGSRLRMRTIQLVAAAAAVVAAAALGHVVATVTSSSTPGPIRVGVAATQQPYLEQQRLALLRRSETHGPRGEMIPV
jgi:predicted anti-sigma-YlaC factor YlaD